MRGQENKDEEDEIIDVVSLPSAAEASSTTVVAAESILSTKLPATEQDEEDSESTEHETLETQAQRRQKDDELLAKRRKSQKTQNPKKKTKKIDSRQEGSAVNVAKSDTEPHTSPASTAAGKRTQKGETASGKSSKRVETSSQRHDVESPAKSPEASALLTNEMRKDGGLPYLRRHGDSEFKNGHTAEDWERAESDMSSPMCGAANCPDRTFPTMPCLKCSIYVCYQCMRGGMVMCETCFRRTLAVAHRRRAEFVAQGGPSRADAVSLSSSDCKIQTGTDLHHAKQQQKHDDRVNVADEKAKLQSTTKNRAAHDCDSDDDAASAQIRSLVQEMSHDSSDQATSGNTRACSSKGADAESTTQRSALLDRDQASAESKKTSHDLDVVYESDDVSTEIGRDGGLKKKIRRRPDGEEREESEDEPILKKSKTKRESGGKRRSPQQSDPEGYDKKHIEIPDGDDVTDKEDLQPNGEVHGKLRRKNKQPRNARAAVGAPEQRDNAQKDDEQQDERKTTVFVDPDDEEIVVHPREGHPDLCRLSTEYILDEKRPHNGCVPEFDLGMDCGQVGLTMRIHGAKHRLRVVQMRHWHHFEQDTAIPGFVKAEMSRVSKLSTMCDVEAHWLSRTVALRIENQNDMEDARSGGCGSRKKFKKSFRTQTAVEFEADLRDLYIAVVLERQGNKAEVVTKDNRRLPGFPFFVSSLLASIRSVLCVQEYLRSPPPAPPTQPPPLPPPRALCAETATFMSVVLV